MRIFFTSVVISVLIWSLTLTCSDNGFNAGVKTKPVIGTGTGLDGSGTGADGTGTGDGDTTSSSGSGTNSSSGVEPGTSGTSSSSGSSGTATGSSGSGTSSGGVTSGSSGSGVDVSSSSGVSLPSSIPNCSAPLSVYGAANPWFAGLAAGAKYKYAKGKCTDTEAKNKPVQVVFSDPTCLNSSGYLYFTVSGAISHDAGKDTTGANGGTPIAHDPGNLFGKSGLTAPLNSLLGVFLDDSDPTSLTTYPTALQYNNADNLTPQLRQVFYIGNGKSGSDFKKFKIPVGAKRFYFGIMDGWEWCDNVGQLTGSVSWTKN